MHFSALQATRLTGCSVSQLGYWDRIGLVSPSVVGTGERGYTFRDLVALRVVGALLDAGLPLQRIGKAVLFLQESGETLDGLRLVSDGATVYACRDDGQVLDALRGGQLALFVSVDAVAADVEAVVREFRRERDEFVGQLRDEDGSGAADGASPG